MKLSIFNCSGLGDSVIGKGNVVGCVPVQNKGDKFLGVLVGKRIGDDANRDILLKALGEFGGVGDLETGEGVGVPSFLF